ncbi:MAG: hypothetical protein WBN68_03710 [Sedimenticolaceae bacterium]
MKRSTKAALLSALVFPGVGHLYAKRFSLGLILAAASAFALYFIVSSAVSKALPIAERILREGVPLDADAIARLVSEQSLGADNSSVSVAAIAFLVLWLVGIFDSYRLGRIAEQHDESHMHEA